jgi:PAS domain S-box-containing protein
MPIKSDLFKAEEQQLRLMVNCIKDYAIFMVDPSGIIISWNKGAERIKGYTAREVVGKHINIFYTEEEISNNEPARNLAITKEKGSFESEGWRLRKNGTLFWAQFTLTAVYDNDENLIGFAKITRDVTERKDSESIIGSLNRQIKADAEEINKLNAILEIKINQLEIANKELALQNEEKEKPATELPT